MTIALKTLPATESPLRILVIEDNPADADLAREALAHQAATIDAVDRISAGLLHLRNGTPDVVLLDLGLPDAQGFDGLRALRAAAPRIPVVVLTGSDDITLGAEAVRTGAEDYLPKQEMNERTLWRTVRYAVERNRSREQERLLALEQAARVQAEQASLAKDRFLATLAHELRNPLAPIRFALDIIEHKAASEAQREQARDAMRRQLHQLIRLVDDLLDVSRITHNRLALQKQWTSLASIIRTAVDSAMPAIESARHEFSLAGPAPDITLNVDAARIAQVLSNLLNNSTKFTPAGGRIWLEARRQDDSAVVCVGDSGIGFDPEAAPRLFQMFHQEDPSTHYTSGLGVGLALARQLTQMHGGTLEATSRGRGLGATFIMRLPIDLSCHSRDAAGGHTKAEHSTVRLHK